MAGNLAENDSTLSEAVITATTSVFEAMLELKVEPQGTELAQDAAQSSEVISLISFTGDYIGTLATFFSSKSALKASAGMLGMECESVADDDVQDIIGEIANMIAGNVKTTIAPTYGELQLSIPIVITGQGLSITSTSPPSDGKVATVSFKNKESWHLIHFKMDNEIFTIGMLVKKIAS